VRLDVKYNQETGSGRGILSIHTDFGGRTVDPVRVEVSCQN
jgi:hypothetical protein